MARLVKLSEIDNLLQTVMFTLYGNQVSTYNSSTIEQWKWSQSSSLSDIRCVFSSANNLFGNSMTTKKNICCYLCSKEYYKMSSKRLQVLNIYNLRSLIFYC